MILTDFLTKLDKSKSLEANFENLSDQEQQGLLKAIKGLVPEDFREEITEKLNSIKNLKNPAQQRQQAAMVRSKIAGLVK